MALPVLLIGCGAHSRASSDDLAKAFRAAVADFLRSDAHAFCRDFTKPVARQLAIEVEHSFGDPRGRGCESALARVFKLMNGSQDRSSGALTALRSVAIRDLHQRGLQAVARVAYAPLTGVGGRRIRFQFADGRWRIAQAPGLEGAWFNSPRSNGAPATESGVLAIVY